MTDLLILLSNTTAAGLRGAVGLLLISRLLSAKNPGIKAMAAAWAGPAAAALILPVFNLPDFFPVALESLFAAVCTVYFQKTAPRISLFIGVFYEIAAAFWQFLTAAWLGVLSRSPVFPEQRGTVGQLSMWLIHGLLILLAWYLFRHREITEKEAFSIVSAISLAGFLGIITLSEQTILKIADDTLDMWTLLSAILMMSVLVFKINRQYETEKELSRLKAQQAELMERNYVALNNAYAVNAKLFHDFHNHIGVLRQLLSHDKPEDAMTYLDALQEPVREMTDTVWTGDETADYLINSKAAAAADHGITFRTQAEFPRHTNIRSADLCAILGNLLDNALDAAKQVPEPEQRLIRLTIRRINQMLIIKVENSFSSPPAMENGSLVTTKKDQGLHGWGLKSARTAAEKYDGTIRTSHSEQIFRAVATLSYQGIAVKIVS